MTTKGDVIDRPAPRAHYGKADHITHSKTFHTLDQRLSNAEASKCIAGIEGALEVGG